MKRYLPEALFFASAIVVLAALRLDAFGDFSEMLWFSMMLMVGELPGVAVAMMAIPLMSLLLVKRAAAIAAPVLGAALVTGAFLLWLLALEFQFRVPEAGVEYWMGLWIVPVLSIVLFIIARIRANHAAALAYFGGAILLAIVYFATPRASDVALVLMKGQSLRTELTASRGRERFAAYDYTYGFPDEGQENLLVYDPNDAATKDVLARFEEKDHCALRGYRVVGSYYAVGYLIDTKCD